MRFLLFLPVVAVVGCASKSAVPVVVAVAPTVAPVASLNGTPMKVTRAENAYINALSRAVALIPNEVPVSVGNQKIAPAKALDFMAARLAKARSELNSVKPSSRLSKVDASFRAALGDMDQGIADAKAALATRDKAALEDAGKRIAKAGDHVNRIPGDMLEVAKER